MSRPRSSPSIQAQVLEVVTRVSETVSDLKSEVGVLRERVDGHNKNQGDSFKHMERRVESELQGISQQLSSDRKAIEDLAKDMSQSKRDIAEINSKIAGLSAQMASSSSGDHLKNLQDRLAEMEHKITKTEGALATLNWLWKAIGGTAIAGVVGVAWFVIKNS